MPPDEPPADRTEVFLGGLPRTPLAAIEAGIHAALMEFVGTREPSDVKLRMHSRGSQGSGFCFAWLPDNDSADRLVEAEEIFFCAGDYGEPRKRAGVRRARGRPDRPAHPAACD